MSAPARVTPSVSETTSRVPRGTLYRGNEGMWSWVLHRITGVAIFFFLLVHILDPALIRVSPEACDAVIGTYKNPIMGIGEVALVVFSLDQEHAHSAFAICGPGFDPEEWLAHGEMNGELHQEGRLANARGAEHEADRAAVEKPVPDEDGVVDALGSRRDFFPIGVTEIRVA